MLPTPRKAGRGDAHTGTHVRAGRMVLGASPPKAATAAVPRRPERAASPARSEDSEDDFRELRRSAKAKAGAASASKKPSAPPPAEAGSANDGLNVHPSYFACEHGMAAKRRAEAEVKAEASGAGAEGELIQFLQLQGLSGPVKSYAQAFLLQGIKDSSQLLTMDASRLAVVLERVQMDSTDELMLKDAVALWR